jgi:signal transduction histidine kinase
MNTPRYHPLLERQVRKTFPDLTLITPELEVLLKLVNDAYIHSDNDRALLERSLDLSSKELGEVNQILSKDIHEQKVLLKKLQSAALELRRTDRKGHLQEQKVDADSLIEIVDNINVEIQERKVAEANLVALLDNTTDSIWSMNTKLELLTFNTAFHSRIATLYQTRVRVGMKLDEIFGFGSKELKIWKSYVERPFKGQRISHDRRITFGSKIIDFEISVNPIISEGRIVGVTVFERDISDRKKSEDEMIRAMKAAEEANRAKSDFLTTMSHELRTPLNAIIGYSELIQENMSDGETDQVVDDSKKIVAAGKHLLDLINEILDLSKIEAGKMEIEISEVRISSVISHLKSVMEYLIHKQQNQCHIEITSKIATLTTDEGRLTQILINLLGNSAKFTSNGTITLRILDEVRNERNGLKFEVEDTGIGIPEEKIAQLFQPFSQLDSSIGRRYGGTGLGLALTKKICELLQGNISCTSQIGKGSTFSVWLPVEFTTEFSHGSAGESERTLAHD